MIASNLLKPRHNRLANFVFASFGGRFAPTHQYVAEILRLILQLSAFLVTLVAVFGAGALAAAIFLPPTPQSQSQFFGSSAPYEGTMGKSTFGDQSSNPNKFNRCDGAFTYVVPETGRLRPLVYCYMFSFPGYSRK